MPTTKKNEKIVELHQLQLSYQVVDVHRDAMTGACNSEGD